MTQAIHQPAEVMPTEGVQWMPARRLREYCIAKVVGASLFAALFAGWVWIQGSNPWMLGFCVVLIVLTAWITAASIHDDLHRARGRQVTVLPNALRITLDDQTVEVPVSSIAAAVWRDEPAEEQGLVLLDAAGQTLARLDRDILADEAEARVMLGWARKHTPLNFPVTWPKPD